MVEALIAAGLTATAAAGFGTHYLYRKAKKQIVIEEEYSTFADVLDAIKLYMVSETKEIDADAQLSDEEIKRLKKRRAQTRDAMTNAPHGVKEAKLYVKGMIHSWVAARIPDEKIRELTGLDVNGEPDHSTMLEIILLKYRKMIGPDGKEYGANGFKAWFDKNGFSNPKPAAGIAAGNAKAFFVTKREFEQAYYNENFKLSDDEVREIFVTKIYEAYLGWGIIDTLAEMNINGYNIGVSGSLMGKPEQDNWQNPDSYSTATNSFWVYYDSAYIHLQFIDFGTPEEIRRISQMLIRYHNPGPLTAKSGFMVNTMHDKSRILVVRPEAGECWGVFVRKFSVDIKSPEQLIIKKGVTNGEFCCRLIDFLINGKLTVAVTGRQGSGKTTSMKSYIAYMPPEWNLRVLEMAPELYLKETYPNREIYSAQETAFVSMEALQDAFKKSDATVTIIGEVATDPVAARMIQLAMTGSEMTIFSHHANTAKDLVLTVRNSLVNAGNFNNMSTAERQVTDVLKVNVHLGFKDGKRFVERITEIRQMDEGIPYPEFDPSDPDASRYKLDKEYYWRQTDRISFTTHDLLRYNRFTDTYEVAEEMSEYLYNRILAAMPMDRRHEFEEFYAWYWKHESINGYEGEAIYSPDIRAEIDENADEVYDEESAINFLKEEFRLI